MTSTVLIVDDHPSFRASARTLLEDAGFEVIGEAADGESAIDATRRLRPDIVLLDIRLPGMDGFEVARRVADLPMPPEVVLTSSHDADTYRTRLRDAPARGFIGKADLSAAAIATIVDHR